MRGRIIFMLEEPSMKELLSTLVPRFFPGLVEGQHFLCVPHQGKTDLEQSLPKKLRGWKVPGDRFVVLEDNDGRDCKAVKHRLATIAAEAGRQDACLIRIVCQELEAWYLGDLRALAEAFGDPDLDSEGWRKRFSNPDAWSKPSGEVARMVPAFQKRIGARMMGTKLNWPINQSTSCQSLFRGLSRLTAEMGYPPAS